MQPELNSAREAIGALPCVRRVGNFSLCRGCLARVIWCTTVRGKRIAMNLDATAHWATCPEASRFREVQR